MVLPFQVLPTEIYTWLLALKKAHGAQGVYNNRAAPVLNNILGAYHTIGISCLGANNRFQRQIVPNAVCKIAAAL
jgi:hypothetical protein